MGEVAFIGPVDLRGLVLDDIVDIDKGKIQVYGLPDGAPRPAIGQGLNKPALLSFRCDSFCMLGGHSCATLCQLSSSTSCVCLLAFCQAHAASIHAVVMRQDGGLTWL